jgi:hypothetical protein
MFRPLWIFLSLVGVLWVATAEGASPEDVVREHAKVRLEVARQGLAVAEQDIEGAPSEAYRDIWVWSRRVLKAELALSTTKGERIAAWEGHLRRAAKLEKIAQRQFSRGGFTRLAVFEAIYRRVDVEVQLAEERSKPESPYR